MTEGGRVVPSSGDRFRVEIVAAGPVESDLLEFLASGIRDALFVDARVRDAAPVPSEAFHPARRQYDSTTILELFLGRGVERDRKLLVVTSEDLFIPVFTFVFGEAVLGGAVATMSTYRLRQELYGLPRDDRLLFLRAEKEAFHELGHTFGLVHCPDPECVMRVSYSVEHVDSKSAAFCAPCGARIRRSLELSATSQGEA